MSRSKLVNCSMYSDQPQQMPNHESYILYAQLGVVAMNSGTQFSQSSVVSIRWIQFNQVALSHAIKCFAYQKTQRNNATLGQQSQCSRPFVQLLAKAFWVIESGISDSVECFQKATLTPLPIF
jgi:hypothetical protein